LREAAAAVGGVEIDCRGEEFLFAFARARDGVAAALAGRRAHASEAWPDGEALRVRMGVHTGEPTVRDDGYLGLDVHRGARICAAAHGGQVLLSQATFDLIAGAAVDGPELVDLGEHRLKGLGGAERLYQVGDDAFPALRVADAGVAVAGREHELARLVRAAVRGPERLRELVAGLRRREPGLAELGWRARALRTPAERDALDPLGGDLFAAARSVADVDGYLERIDRKGLASRAADYSALGVISERAAREADSYARQVADIEDLFETRARVPGLAREVDVALSQSGDRAEIGRRVRALTATLDAQLEQARNDLGAMSVKLRRTWVRGVYRLGSSYAVPYYDDLGVEARKEFETLSDARRFRAAIRVKEKEWGRHRDRSVWERVGGPGGTGVGTGGDGGGAGGG